MVRTRRSKAGAEAAAPQEQAPAVAAAAAAEAAAPDPELVVPAQVAAVAGSTAAQDAVAAPAPVVTAAVVAPAPVAPAAPMVLTLGALTFEIANQDTADHTFKGLFFGQSGSGKSWLAASGNEERVGDPSVFVLLTEKNGLQSVRQSNPDARVVVANDIGTVREFMKAAAQDKLRALGCRRIVLDSLTEIQRLMKDEILSKKPAGEGMALQDWGELTERMRRFMRMIRDVPYDLVCTALDATEAAEEGVAGRVYPSFEGKKLHNEVAQYFNLVGYVFKKQRADADGAMRVEHGVMLEGPTRYLVKPCSPLGGVMQGPLGPWFTRLSAGK